MNPERLLQHFERISEAPDAIPRLRQFILDLAVRGKLVEQDPNDEPMAELLKRIQAEKARLVRIGVLKKEKPLPTVKPDEVPFSVPSGWGLVRLTSLCGLENGDRSKNYPSRDELVADGIPFINAGHLEAGEIRLDDMNFITQKRFDILNSGKIRDGDILFCLRGSLGKTALVSGLAQGAIASSLVIIRLAGHLSVMFMLSYLSSPLAFEMIKRFDNGTAQPNLSSADLGKFVVPLPPLAEQHRIVAKVDELMALCDQLETAKTEREQSRDRLVAASLYCLNSPADTAETDVPDLPALQADTFRDHARFVFIHLPRLTTRPEHIKQLRQTILNLAVCGKLVPQDPNDEPASELLKRIQAEKARLVKEGKISREKPLLPAGDDELAFGLKPGWQATRISQILVELQTGPFGSSLHQSDYQKGGIPVINPASIKNERLVPIDGMAVGPATLERLATFKLRAGDIVMGRRGEMGRCAVVTEHEAGWLCGTGSLILRLPECVFPRFFVTLIGSPFVREYLGESAVGATMQNLHQSILLNLIIGLPPLAEQHRIVARVDALMALCDQLEAQLIATEANSRRLLEAVLHEALAPAMEATA